MDNSTYKTLQNLTILNWNANGIKAQRSLLISFLARYNVDVACITETHLSDGEVFKISGYHTLRFDRSARTASGGVAIFIKRQILYTELENPPTDSLEAVSVNVNINKTTSLKITSTYKQPNRKLKEADFFKLFDATTSTLMIGDLNSKSTLWGCRANNASGTILNHIAAVHQLQISAPSEYTYFPYRNDHQPDILDIVVTKNFNLPLQQTVINELDSDHLPVLITFAGLPLNRPSSPRLIKGLVNWNIFKKSLDEIIVNPSQIDSPLEIDTNIEKLTKSISDAISTSTKQQPPTRKNNPNIPPLYILNLIKEKSRLRREWQRTRSPNTKTLLNNITHLVRREIDNHRIDTYRKHIENLEPNDPGLWKATKCITRQQITIPTLKNDNISYSSDEEKCNLFAEYLEVTYTPTIPDESRVFFQELVTFNETHLPTSDDFNQPTSPKELTGYIQTLSLKKSPGHDLIPNVVLKNLTRKATAFLANIFNACLRLGYFPNNWKHAHILMFHKHGKSKNECGSYRPISLLPTLSKLLEKVISYRLNLFLDENHTIPPTQFGFRRGHSATYQLQRISEIIEQGFEKKQYTTAAFLDITKAFDKVWIEGLKYKLLHIGCPHYLASILFSFLEDRSFAVKINATLSCTKNIHAGVPQGSILGPTLFNIYVYDIPHNTNNQIATFADDTALITQNEDINLATQQLQISLDRLNIWLNKWGITLNSSKCMIKVFTLKRLKELNNITIKGETIPWTPPEQAVKYLGVYLDTRLTWSEHINHKLNQGYARLGQLYPLINKNTPLKRECTLLLYKSLLRSLVTFACPIWSATSATNIKKIQTFQNKILRMAVNAPWFVRNQQIHDELGIDTIEQFIKKSTKKFLNNMKECSSVQYHQLGRRNIHRRLKRRLPQDLFT